MADANDLISTIRRNRELKVTVGQYVFTCRRPTDSEIERYRDSTIYSDTLAQHHVIGWGRADGGAFTESDFLGGGGGTDPVPFELPLWLQWCADHMEVWTPIGDAVTNAFTEHRKDLRQAEKNS